MKNIHTFFKMLHELVNILNVTQKRRAIALMILMMMASLMEMFGVGVIVPFIAAMLDTETLMQNEFLQPIVRKFNIVDRQQFLLMIVLGIIIVYIIKNVFILIVNYGQSKYRNDLEKDLNVKMLEAYMKHPYIYFVNTNSANIIRGVNGDMANVASVVDSYSTIFSEGLNAIAIGIFLVCLSPYIAVSLLFFAGLTALFIILCLKKKVSMCGERARQAFAEKYISISHAINGIKEITIAYRRKHFIDKFSEAAEKAARANTKYLWFSKLPNRLIETMFICGLVVTVFVSLKNSNGNIDFITQLGAVGVAAVRILPSISTLTNAMNSLIYLRPSLEEAYFNLKEAEKYGVNENRNEIDTKFNFENNLKLEDISWRYQENMPYVLNGLSLEIRKGEAIGLVGESGAGKSTLADVILGLYTPQRGRVLLDGHEISEGKEWAKMVGYVPQTVYLIDDTIKNNVAFGIDEDEIDDKEVWRAIEKAQLCKMVQGLEGGLESKVGEKGIKLSGGQRQRIAIARALYHNPEIIVLDEATSALDNETENAIMEAIDALQGEKTLIIIAHRLTTVRKCDRIYEVAQGKVFAKSYEEIMEKEK